jgi:RHH-type proline utilization regulon transcriptional repressor/proline dehydrogenase/delta 1-pyrroline-5-carboxylate dehydrogenase
MIPVNEREQRIAVRGKELLERVRAETPDFFSPGAWSGKILEKAMADERFRASVLRFLDAASGPSGLSRVQRMLRDYFGDIERDIPAAPSWWLSGLGVGGKLGARFEASALRGAVEKSIRRRLAGETHKEALKTLAKLRKEGFAAVLDRLGPAALSEEDADACEQDYLELLNAVEVELPRWKALGDKALDWGVAPLLQISVRPSAFSCRLKPSDPEGAVEAAYERLAPIYRRLREMGGFLWLDMETSQHKALVIALFKKLRGAPDFRDSPHLGLTLQASLRDTDGDLDALLAWAREQALPIAARLVKGARWAQERVRAAQQGWPSPVHERKAETDAAFERQAALLLENHDICRFACATHNLRTISAVLELARELRVPERAYEFQIHYGPGERIAKVLHGQGLRVRVCCPYGGLQDGAAHLRLRFREITGRDSFLRHCFAEKASGERLLESPLAILERLGEAPEDVAPAEDAGFRYEPATDFSRPETRAAFLDALAQVRGRQGRQYALRILDEEAPGAEQIDSVNPAAPEEVLGRVGQASMVEIEQAVGAARRAFPAWRETPASVRVGILRKTAEIARRRFFALAATLVLEVGMSWEDASAEVVQAIDHLEYAARGMLGLAEAPALERASGERNQYFYEPLGVLAVISCCGSPLAAACGMSASALVTGNAVVFKPSNQAPVIGHALFELFQEAGLPPGLLNYLPGRGDVIGDYLVEHPDLAGVVFAGAFETGARVLASAAKIHPEQLVLKRAICELGGKGAILVDEDADLDAAIPAILRSAFGFQGQRRASCSRLLVVDAIHDACVKRLVEACRSLKIGPSEDPSNDLGPLAGAKAQKRARACVELGKRDGRLLLERECPHWGSYAPLTIFDELDPASPLLQEEIDGPLLLIQRVKDFDQALAQANALRLGSVCAVFARNPAALARARRELRFGAVFLNQGTSDARVGRQPLGGLKLSGQGAMLGGPDYLLRFLNRRLVAERARVAGMEE